MHFFIITDNSHQMEGGQVVSDMEQAVTASAQNTGFQCVHCGKIFASKEARRKHVKHVHDKIREHICEVCAKGFFSSSDLNTHRRTHTGEKNFPCHICGQSYTTKQYLIIHTRQHTGEKPHCCEECGKAFADKSALNNHQKQHLNNPPVTCEVCGKTFKIKKTLKRHMMIHNDGGLMTDVNHRFWKKNLFKRLQVGSIEKSSRDWNTSHCKTVEYFKCKTYKHQFCWVIQVVLLQILKAQRVYKC